MFVKMTEDTDFYYIGSTLIRLVLLSSCSWIFCNFLILSWKVNVRNYITTKELFWLALNFLEHLCDFFVSKGSVDNIRQVEEVDRKCYLVFLVFLVVSPSLLQSLERNLSCITPFVLEKRHNVRTKLEHV